MPKIFTSKSRNSAEMSVLKHAGTQMFQNKTDYMKNSLVGTASYGTGAKTERYGVTPFLTKGEEVQNTLSDMDFRLGSKGAYTTGSNPNFFNQVKDLEDYVANLNSRPAHMLNRDFPYMKTFAGRDIQYDVDFFIRQANGFDVLYKKTWNLLEKMKYKLEHTPNVRFASLAIQDSVKGSVYVLQWEDEEMYQASKKVLAHEKELSTFIKRLPEPTMLFQVRHPQFQELVQFRIDVENIIFKLASKSQGTAPYSRGITGTMICDCKECHSRNDDEGNMNTKICRND